MNVLVFVFVLTITITAAAESVAVIQGDVIIGGLFSVYFRDLSSEQQCSNEINGYSVIELEAVKWSIQRLNNINFIPDLKVGLDVFQTCLSSELAGLSANLLIDAKNHEQAFCNITNGLMVGVIGPETTHESDLVSRMLSLLPKMYRLQQISYSATGERLTNRQIYKQFFRTVPSDDIQWQTLINLLVTLEWNYVALIHENNSAGIDGAVSLTQKLTERGICIPASLSFDSSYGVDPNRLKEIVQQITTGLHVAVRGVVFLGGSASAKTFVNVLDGARLGEGTPAVIFSSDVGLRPDVFGTDDILLKGSLILGFEKKEINEFESYVKEIFQNTTKLRMAAESNPWLLDLFKSISGCDLKINACSGFSFAQIDTVLSYNTFVPFAIQSAYIMTKVIKEIHKKHCNNISGLCSKMQNLEAGEYTNVLQTIKVDFTSDFGSASLPNMSKSFQFDSDGNFEIPENVSQYSVYNHRRCIHDPTMFCFEKVADYVNDNLSLDRTKLKDYDILGNERTSYRKAQCLAGKECLPCLPKDEANQILYLPGDLILLAGMPIHYNGGKALTCSGIRYPPGYDVALGALFAVEKVNNKTSGLFGNKKVGLLLFDTCNSPMVIQEKLLSFFKNGNKGLPSDLQSKIIAALGEIGSTPTIGIVSVTNSFGIPHVGCCSTSPSLSDRSKYPYFVRVSMPLTESAEAMLAIAHSIGVNYAQIIYSSGEYGEQGNAALISLAKKYSICIANSIEVPVLSVYNKIIENLRKTPSARTVFVFLRSHVSPFVFDVLLQQMNVGEFQFIGSEAWGTREVYLQYRKLKGSIVAVQEMPQSKEYENYLKTLYPSPTDTNTWLISFMQQVLDCYFPWSFNKTLRRPCTEDDHLPGYVDSVDKLDPWIPYFINSALAALIGADSALRSLCGVEREMCDSYRDNPSKVIDFIKQVKLDIAGNGTALPVFDSGGNGRFGHRIYNIQSDKNNPSTLYYQRVGEWSLDSKLNLERENLVLSDETADSTCPNPQACSKCFPENNHGSYKNKPDSNGLSTTALIAAIVVLSVILVVLVVILFIRCYRNRKSGQEDTYLDVIGPQENNEFNE